MGKAICASVRSGQQKTTISASSVSKTHWPSSGVGRMQCRWPGSGSAGAVLRNILNIRRFCASARCDDMPIQIPSHIGGFLYCRAPPSIRKETVCTTQTPARLCQARISLCPQPTCIAPRHRPRHPSVGLTCCKYPRMSCPAHLRHVAVTASNHARKWSNGLQIWPKLAHMLVNIDPI